MEKEKLIFQIPFYETYQCPVYIFNLILRFPKILILGD